MNIKIAFATAALVAIAVPVAVFANQPRQVDLATLAPSADAQATLETLMIDPYAATDLSITLPTRAAELDLDRDPFAAARS